jgi:flagellar basal-body rod modification protein FlgD
MTTTTDPIAAYAATTQQSSATSTIGRSASQLNSTDFLTLMSAQLKNQDPLNPLQSTDFVAQLAQFGTVSGIQSMQTSLSTLSDSLRSSQVLSGTNLVGHDITAAADSIALSDTSGVTGSITVPDGATAMKVTIKDSSGQIVGTMDMPTSKTSEDFTWDGTLDGTTHVPAGQYSIEASATVDGKGTAAEVLLSTRVSSVTLGADGTTLSLNTSSLGTVALDKVRSVT